MHVTQPLHDTYSAIPRNKCTQPLPFPLDGRGENVTPKSSIPEFGSLGSRNYLCSAAFTSLPRLALRSTKSSTKRRCLSRGSFLEVRCGSASYVSYRSAEGLNEGGNALPAKKPFWTSAITFTAEIKGQGDERSRSEGVLLGRCRCRLFPSLLRPFRPSPPQARSKSCSVALRGSIEQGHRHMDHCGLWRKQVMRH